MDVEAELFWTWMSGLLYNPILALVKTSALVFMFRIAGHITSVRWSILVSRGAEPYRLSTPSPLRTIEV